MYGLCRLLTRSACLRKSASRGAVGRSRAAVRDGVPSRGRIHEQRGAVTGTERGSGEGGRAAAARAVEGTSGTATGLGRGGGSLLGVLQSARGLRTRAGRASVYVKLSVLRVKGWAASSLCSIQAEKQRQALTHVLRDLAGFSLPELSRRQVGMSRSLLDGQAAEPPDGRQRGTWLDQRIHGAVLLQQGLPGKERMSVAPRPGWEETAQ